VLPKKSLRFLSLILFITLLITSCGGATPSGTYVWIDVPMDGLSFPEVQPITIEGHATGDSGVSRIELFVDGEPWIAIEDPLVENNLARFEAEWLPPGTGTYSIHVVAYGSDDAVSAPDEIVISFGVETPTPVITVTPVISVTPIITDTPTPLPEPDANVSFLADPETIDAGKCTDLRWQAENVKSLVFGGVEQEMEGVFNTCLCKNETYTLTVTHLDDTVEKLKANINVVGTCTDTKAPPAPNQTGPGSGSSLTCRSYQDVSWGAVTDASGISQYQVNAQRHSGDNNWTNVSGSTFTGISGTSYHMSVECGWYYRWQVRAVDGEGNVGPWSDWWTFIDNLS
jgi:hypothetical protein